MLMCSTSSAPDSLRSDCSLTEGHQLSGHSPHTFPYTFNAHSQRLPPHWNAHSTKGNGALIEGVLQSPKVAHPA